MVEGMMKTPLTARTAENGSTFWTAVVVASAFVACAICLAVL
jgi:hypothetical protein